MNKLVVVVLDEDSFSTTIERLRFVSLQPHKAAGRNQIGLAKRRKK
jgi:hypothetical protein